MTRRWMYPVALVMALGCHRSTSVEPTGGPTVLARGRVVSLNPRPFPNTVVRITGCPDQVAWPDATFDTSCASIPYDLAVSDGPHGCDGVVYQGLTRRDPVVTIPVFFSGAGSTNVAGNVIGLNSPDRFAAVTITSSGSSQLPIDTWARSGGAYTAWASWSFDDPLPSATVRAIERTMDPSGPTAFPSYGALVVPLIAGTTATASPTLEPIANGTLYVSIEPPQPAYGIDLWAEWPEGGAAPLARFWRGASGTVPAPDIPGATYTILSSASGGGVSNFAVRWAWRRGLPATAAPAPVTIPTAAAITGPAFGALVDSSTDFTFTGIPDAVYLVVFKPAVASDPNFYIVTSATTVRIPDFAWAGLGSPQANGSAYLDVSVTALGPFASADDAASGPLWLLPDSWGAGYPNRIPPVDGFATRDETTVRVW